MENEIKLTPASKIVEMTKALPEIPNGARPVEYSQVIESAKLEASEQSGKPDPAHID